MSEAAAMVPVSEVRIGDRLRTRSGAQITVTRIDDGFLDIPGMIAFVEDSEAQWLKMPAPRDGEVELIARAAASG